MTEVLLETLLERLQRKLSLPDPDSEELALLADELSDAEGKLLLYLDVDALEERFHGTVVELAALVTVRRCPALWNALRTLCKQPTRR